MIIVYKHAIVGVLFISICVMHANYKLRLCFRSKEVMKFQKQILTKLFGDDCESVKIVLYDLI